MGLLLRFNLIAMAIFLIGLVVAEYMALRDIRARVHADLVTTSALADYLIESQTQRLQFDFQNFGDFPEGTALSRVFDLQRMHQLKHLDVSFIGTGGELLDSNHPSDFVVPAAMPDWLYNFLARYLYETPVVKPVNLAGEQLGEIHISHNLDSEINEIWQTSKDVILPLLLVFFFGSLLIALLASLVLRPAEKLLHVSRQLTGEPSAQRRVFAGMLGLLSAGDELDGIGRQLQTYNRQLRELNVQMQTMHESERKRLSAELHDEIGQHLTAIRFDTATIASAVDLAEAKQAGQSIDKINRQLTDIIRSMLKRLRPPSLDIAGLEVSLTELTEEWQLRHPHHDLQLQIDGDLTGLKDTVKLTLYRAVQEALTNIIRHAGNTVSVNIHLKASANKLFLTISDNGKGCDLQHPNSGVGLLAMRERVEALSGAFRVSSAPGAGLTVTLSIPQ